MWSKMTMILSWINLFSQCIEHTEPRNSESQCVPLQIRYPTSDISRVRSGSYVIASLHVDPSGRRAHSSRGAGNQLLNFETSPQESRELNRSEILQEWTVKRLQKHQLVNKKKKKKKGEYEEKRGRENEDCGLVLCCKVWFNLKNVLLLFKGQLHQRIN